jgi:UDP-N-acetylglucosamine--N-acetylmuramyl-(pentapeptide) pyrophosphoryl-undecaprenol N-acetylglucosamine transferase
MNETQHIVFSGGGTGGHLFPGLAVAQELARQAADANDRLKITFAGSGKSFERRHVEVAGFEYLVIPSQPLPRRPWHLPHFVGRQLAGWRVAHAFVSRVRPSVVAGLGGYASVPMSLAAVKQGVPLVLLEQNAVPGKANRWLAPRAQAICAAFASARPSFRVSDEAFYFTGNPVRHTVSRDLQKTDSPQLYHSTPLLVIVGGSRGARELNRLVPRALAQFASGLRGWRILHQTGIEDEAATRALYAELGMGGAAFEVVPFIDDLPSVLLDADLAVCRAGGTTLAELALAGVPAIVCPYPFAADNHQRRNADVFAAAGACRIFDTREVTGDPCEALARSLAGLIDHPTVRARMSIAMRRRAMPHATRDVAGVIQSLVGQLV